MFPKYCKHLAKTIKFRVWHQNAFSIIFCLKAKKQAYCESPLLPTFITNKKKLSLDTHFRTAWWNLDIAFYTFCLSFQKLICVRYLKLFLHVYGSLIYDRFCSYNSNTTMHKNFKELFTYKNIPLLLYHALNIICPSDFQTYRLNRRSKINFKHRNYCFGLSISVNRA